MILTLPCEPIKGFLSFLSFPFFLVRKLLTVILALNHFQWQWSNVIHRIFQNSIWFLVWLCTLVFIKSSAHFEADSASSIYMDYRKLFSDYIFLVWWSFPIFIYLVHYTFIYVRIAGHLIHHYHEIYGSLVVCFKKVGTLGLWEGEWNCKERNRGFLGAWFTSVALQSKVLNTMGLLKPLHRLVLFRFLL